MVVQSMEVIEITLKIYCEENKTLFSKYKKTRFLKLLMPKQFEI